MEPFWKNQNYNETNNYNCKFVVFRNIKFSTDFLEFLLDRNFDDYDSMCDNILTFQSQEEYEQILFPEHVQEKRRDSVETAILPENLSEAEQGVVHTDKDF